MASFATSSNKKSVAVIVEVPLLNVNANDASFSWNGEYSSSLSSLGRWYLFSTSPFVMFSSIFLMYFTTLVPLENNPKESSREIQN